MKYFMISVLFLLMAGGVYQSELLASGGHDDHDGGHGQEGAMHAHEESGHGQASGKKAVLVEEKDGYKYTLEVSPEQPKTGEAAELELEIMDVRDIESSFGEGFPVADKEVTVRLKEQETNKEVTLHAHSEGDAGVYGVHHVFSAAGSHHAIFEWKESDGTERFVHFDVEVLEGEDVSHAGIKQDHDHHDETEEESGHHH